MPESDCFGRICPRCWKLWDDRRLWFAETVQIGTERRGERHHVIVKQHEGCGGRMYTQELQEGIGDGREA